VDGVSVVTQTFVATVLGDNGFVPNWLENRTIPEVVAVGAGLFAIATIWKFGIRPVSRWIKKVTSAIIRISERIDDIPIHGERIEIIEQKVDFIIETMRPTNGDLSSISDRVDKAKKLATTVDDKVNVLMTTLGVTDGDVQRDINVARNQAIENGQKIDMLFSALGVDHPEMMEEDNVQ
jgi:hypothetical protein